MGAGVVGGAGGETDVVFVAELPEGFFGGGFGGGVEDCVFGFVAEALGDGLGPVVPVFLGGLVALSVGVTDGCG